HHPGDHRSAAPSLWQRGHRRHRHRLRSGPHARISAVKAHTWLVLPISMVVVAGCSNNAGGPAKPPTAQEILAKPDTANVKDGHFSLVAHIVTGNITFDATGDGIVVVKPQQASQFTMLTTIAGQSLKFETIIIGGKEYDLSPD